MKYILLTLLLINTVIWATPILAESVTGTLVPPTHRTDGVQLMIGELASCKIYFHETIKNHWTEIILTDDMTQFRAEKPPGTYEIYATAMDSEGRESQPSNKITRVIDFGPPIIIKIQLTAPMSPILLILEPEIVAE